MFGWLFGQKKKEPKWSITLDSSLQHSAQLTAAWIVYAGVKSKVRDGSYTAIKPDAHGKDTPFDEECFARDALAEYWAVQKPEVRTTDPYLNLLAEVRAAGLVREYVWKYLRQPGWPEPPNLALSRLETWMNGMGAAMHDPVTLSFVLPA
jgi:hypothetical protein